MQPSMIAAWKGKHLFLAELSQQTVDTTAFLTQIFGDMSIPALAGWWDLILEIAYSPWRIRISSLNR